MTLEITLIIGLIAALFMFTGDMTMYYHPDDYYQDGTYKSVIELMKNISDRRLYIGDSSVRLPLFCIAVDIHMFSL